MRFFDIKNFLLMSSDRIDPDLHAIHADPSSPEEPYPFTTGSDDNKSE
jgi:hypothetical protein